jgi:hypothetical protein
VAVIIWMLSKAVAAGRRGLAPDPIAEPREEVRRSAP